MSADRGRWRVVDLASGAVLLEQDVTNENAHLAAVSAYDQVIGLVLAGYEVALEWMDPDGEVASAGEWQRDRTVRLNSEGELEWSERRYA